MSEHMVSTTLDEKMLSRIAKVKVADLADGHQDLGNGKLYFATHVGYYNPPTFH